MATSRAKVKAGKVKAAPGTSLDSSAAAAVASRPTTTQLDARAVQELKGSKNVTFYNDEGFKPELVCETSLLTPFVDKYRKLYLDLRFENPSWRPRDTLRYIYEQDAYFGDFYNKWPSLARYVCSEDFDAPRLNDFIALRQQHADGQISAVAAAQTLLHHAPSAAQDAAAAAVDPLVQRINTEFGGSTEAFLEAARVRRERTLKTLKRQERRSVK